jgi:hypothetical protein
MDTNIKGVRMNCISYSVSMSCISYAKIAIITRRSKGGDVDNRKSSSQELAYRLDEPIIDTTIYSSFHG